MGVEDSQLVIPELLEFVVEQLARTCEVDEKLLVTNQSDTSHQSEIDFDLFPRDRRLTGCAHFRSSLLRCANIRHVFGEGPNPIEIISVNDRSNSLTTPREIDRFMVGTSVVDYRRQLFSGFGDVERPIGTHVHSVHLGAFLYLIVEYPLITC